MEETLQFQNGRHHQSFRDASGRVRECGSWEEGLVHHHYHPPTSSSSLPPSLLACVACPPTPPSASACLPALSCVSQDAACATIL
ncbi:hypothetical protein AALO_G00183210 [Alosa alosa]|uniref:Uncharacterized protein n=1 Tax=Alosa alosa TaxID=278164 RepID=A0AAV6GDW1_9TELE|nr:hypothetical protein AALO_G00183210 [Alosa alosa]